MLKMHYSSIVPKIQPMKGTEFASLLNGKQKALITDS